MAKIYSPRMVGDKLGLTHQEVIRRLRRGDIVGQKLGWNWIITAEEVEAAVKSDWYQRLLAKRTNDAAATA